MLIYKTEGDLVGHIQDITGVDTYIFEGKKSTEDIILIDVDIEERAHASNSNYDYWHTIEVTYAPVNKYDKMKINKIMKGTFNCTAEFGYDSANDRSLSVYKISVVVEEW